MHQRIALFVLLLCAAASLVAADEAWLTITSDRDDGVYTSKSKATFTLTAVGNTAQDAKLNYKVHWDHGKDLAQGEVVLKGGKAELVQILPEPGCLVLEVTLDKQKAEYGAVADPFKIMPSRTAPKDFDAFWDAEKQALVKVPMNAQLVPTTTDLNKATYGPVVECFDLTLDCTGGKPVRGYYVRPKGAKVKSLPAFLSLHSAGVRDSSIQAAWNQAKSNRIALDINAHGVDNGKPVEFYNGLRDGELRGYQSKGIDKRNTFYFKGMYLRIIRAIDFLTSQPEWDGKIVIAAGASQGGGQSLIAGGIDARVTELWPTVPAFCDLTAAQLGRQSGWPGNVASTPQGIETVGYFDACHFAARFKGKTHIVVGLIDHTCPPAGIFAAFNQLGGEKSIAIMPLRGHGGDATSARLEKDPRFTHRP
ncbi:MAG: acetylxylan esterase [Planctomycetota bacterium]